MVQKGRKSLASISVRIFRSCNILLNVTKNSGAARNLYGLFEAVIDKNGTGYWKIKATRMFRERTTERSKNCSDFAAGFINQSTEQDNTAPLTIEHIQCTESCAYLTGNAVFGIGARIGLISWKSERNYKDVAIDNLPVLLLLSVHSKAPVPFSWAHGEIPINNWNAIQF